MRCYVAIRNYMVHGRAYMHVPCCHIATGDFGRAYMLPRCYTKRVRMYRRLYMLSKIPHKCFLLCIYYNRKLLSKIDYGIQICMKLNLENIIYPYYC
jgi:hypothetical protein